MALNTYNPKEVAIIVGGNIIDGFADGTFINVERDEDSYTLQVGSDGEATRSKNNNLSGTVTLTLRQGSPSNAILSALAQQDELNGSGIVPLLVKDNSGSSIHSAETAWIQKPSAAEYGRESGSREWVIRTDRLQTFIGGNG